MNLLQHFKHNLLRQYHYPVDSFIEDKLPASRLLGEQDLPITDPTPDGEIPVTLTQETCIRFHLIPKTNRMTGIQLRFGTYCRVNQCHISIQVNHFTHRFHAADLVDNEYINISFPAAQPCTPGQPVIIAIYSQDASEDDVVAVWCTQQLTAFINSITSTALVLTNKEAIPRVSIVIPVFNKVLYTYNCLLAIQAVDPEISKEIILINNASTDQTMMWSKHLQGAFKIIHNSENRGFVRACRQGAEKVSGEFILFLNNDTQVRPGWLSRMVNIMDTHPDVGITGSKLIYPNGQLQEAGSIIFSDASGWNYGRLQNPEHFLFNQSREVDYCSGASLMIRQTLWQELGGFDKRYIPAYYEDTDLCFAARQAGYKVFYCHDSEVIHYEGITAGTDLQMGCKAFQVVNQKKFQAKWWEVLLDYPLPPPQTSPDMAAFRYMAESPFPFQIPKTKILATHLLAQGWAANFWSYLNLNQIEEELKFIQSVGFNTVILLVPWVGFQTQVDPITYHEEYLTLLKQLLDKIQASGLQVILRLGYSHDNGPKSEPEGFVRQVVVGAESVMWTAWCDYLDRLWQIVQDYSNVLVGFMSWEDFFFMDLTRIPLENRLLFAQRTGYQDYLAQNYSLAEISKYYQATFSSYAEIPIPAFKMKGIDLFCEFWDHILIHKIFKGSKTHFPRLTMEVRLDGDPQEESHVYHNNTFDLLPDIPLTLIYYSPAWGAPNDGQQEPATHLLNRLQWLFNHLRTKTHNVIFIDQFNFIDNTPGFEHNTQILPEQLSEFLTGVADILYQQTIGYGMWALRDVRANVLKNGLFERDYPSWEVKQGEIVSDTETGKKAVALNTGGYLRQLLDYSVGVSLLKDRPFQLDFQVKKTPLMATKLALKVSIISNAQTIYQKIIYNNDLITGDADWQPVHLEGIPFEMGQTLKIENQGISVLLTDFYLYQVRQENGIIDANGHLKSFYHDLVQLNQKLSHQPQKQPQSFFSNLDIASARFEGVFPDLWMGKKLIGLITKPETPNNQLSFIIKAYVPETWHDYHNKLMLSLNNMLYRINQTIKTGYNEIVIKPIESSDLDDILFLQIEAETVFSPQKYDTQSQDNREVTMQLIEFGFLPKMSSSEF